MHGVWLGMSLYQNSLYNHYVIFDLFLPFEQQDPILTQDLFRLVT